MKKKNGEKSEARMDEFCNCAIITPHRGKRPEDFATERKMKTSLPEKCFFCPGNERLDGNVGGGCDHRALLCALTDAPAQSD